MDPEKELEDRYTKVTFANIWGSPPLKLLNTRNIIWQFSNTSDKSPLIELLDMLRYLNSAIKLQNLSFSMVEISELEMSRYSIDIHGGKLGPNCECLKFRKRRWKRGIQLAPKSNKKVYPRKPNTSSLRAF